MTILQLWRDEELLWSRPLDETPLEVGRAESCDLVLEGDPTVPLRAVLLWRRGRELCWREVDARGPARRLPPGETLPLGRRYALRVAAPGSRCGEPTDTSPVTEVLEPRGGEAEPPPRAALRLVLTEPGRGRRIRHLPAEPLVVGSSPRADIVLHDPAVSARHARLEPTGDGALLLRDLGSRNGTWMHGLRIAAVRLAPGAHVRLGRSTLALVWVGESSGPVRAERRDEAPLARDPATVRLLEELGALAPLPWPLLLLGETGSGKERMARWVHLRSGRAKAPFVAINCGALPATLLESELFGHEKSAFTGAEQAHRGAFEQAHGGTLLLDEIGEMPLEQQARLLRVLESGRVRRVGAERERDVDVRVVAATHRDLRQAVAEGRFRADLYCRLARLVARIPPLRERPRDVEALAGHFLQEASAQIGPRHLTSEAVARLLVYPWPGNVRELQNVVLTAAVGSPQRAIGADAVEVALRQVALQPDAEPWPPGMEAAVGYLGDSVAALARLLGMPRTTLRDRLRRAGARAA